MKSKKPGIIAVLPAYNAAGSLRMFFDKFPFEVFDEVIFVDDDSKDKTLKMAKRVRGIEVYKNVKNLGYGGNMKRCLDLALKSGADIIVEIHPDGEYGFDGILPGIEKIKKGADLVLGNRFYAPFSGVRSGMYFWKIPFTKGLTHIGNLVLGTNIPDMHQGFRIYSKPLLEKINYSSFSNDFLFTFETIAATILQKKRIESVPVKSFYKGEKRGVGFKTSINYSLRTIWVLIIFLFKKQGGVNNNNSATLTGKKRNASL